MRFLRAALVATLLAGCGEEATSPSTHEQPTLALATAAGPLSFRQVSTGRGHACGVTTDDRAYCWGYSLWGQLGHGSYGGPEECNTHPCSSRPVAVVGGLRFRSVSTGDEHSCGVTTDNRVYCWGRNTEGQLGDGTQNGSATPVAVAGTRRFREVTAGGAHTCAITTTDLAFCWGYNKSGQLGIGTTTDQLTPARVLGGLLWRQLSAGAIHTCGRTTADRAYCWGNNTKGELGNGSTTPRLKPAAVSSGLQFRQIDAGFNHTCAVTSSGYRAYCWGGNDVGGIGDGTRTTRLTPTPVVDTRRYDQVSAGGFHTCGVLRTSGKGMCWGAGVAGQLGNGTRFRRATPTPVSGSLLLAQISAGFGSTCAVTTGSRAYCWGDNFPGQLGDGTTDSHLAPTAVAPPT